MPNKGIGSFIAMFSDNKKLYKVNIHENEPILLCDDNANFINVIGDWVYYVNWINDFFPYKIRTDGTERTMLCEDEAWNMVVVDEWIYYISRTDRGKLYKIRIDGTDRTMLSDDVYMDFCVDDDWIYYARGFGFDEGLVKMRTDGSEKIILDIKVVTHHEFNVVDGWIYYSNDEFSGLYKIRTDGTENTKLCSDIALCLKR
jgi:hypothetical protein